MGQLLLKFLLSLYGMVCILLALSIFGLGPHATVQLASAFGEKIVGPLSVVTDLNSISIDSELRFFSVLLFAFGFICIQAALKVPNSSQRIYLIAVIILLGGIGRAWSNISVGAPNSLFVFLMWVELVFPFIIALLARRTSRKFKGF